MRVLAPYTVLFPAGSQGILVVANGTRRVRATAKLIARIHAREQVRVHVASVQVRPTGYAGRFLRHIDVRGLLEDSGRRAVAPLCAELDKLGVPYRTHIEVGPWLAGISRLAAELGCAQVLVGSVLDAWLLRSALRDKRHAAAVRSDSTAHVQ